MSNRIDNMNYSPMHKYYEIAKEISEEGIEVFNLSSAQPNKKTDKSYYQALKKISEEANAYGDCRGLEELRIEFANYYNEKTSTKNKFNKRNVQITLGASDAIISLLMAICDEGDTVIVIEPFFCDYKNYCEMLNINTFFVKLEDLAKDIVLPNRSKAILFSNPNNPSGNILNKKQMLDIIEIANRNNLYIISDEVYNELVYDTFISFASFDYENIIIVDSVSKKFNNCGARIGAIITKNKKIILDMTKIYDSRISISNTEQVAVTNMFKNKDSIFKDNLKKYIDKITKIKKFLNKLDLIEFEKPQGGVFFLLSLPVEDTDLLAEWLLKKFRKNNKTVLILPTSKFYSNSRNKIRLSITNSSEYIIEALNLLVDAMKEYKKEGYL